MSHSGEPELGPRPSKMQVLDRCIAVESEEARAAPSAEDTRPHRIRIRADGRCAVRAVLHGSRAECPLGVCAAQGTDPCTHAFVREARIRGVEALQRRMGDDPEFADLVRCTFPDESFATFDEYVAAQHADDTGNAVSELWKGGGSWTLFGLGLSLGVRIVVSKVTAELEIVGSAQEVVDGSRIASCGHVDGERVEEQQASAVHLLALHDDDDAPTHFDVLASSPNEPGAQPLIPRTEVLRRAAPVSRSTSVSSVSTGASMWAWAALNLLIALVLACGPCLPKPPASQERLSMPSVWSGGDDLLASLAATSMARMPSLYQSPGLVRAGGRLLEAH